MTLSFTDVFSYATQCGRMVFQGATAAGIAFLASRYLLQEGTVAMVPMDESTALWEAMDDAGLASLCF